MNRFGFWLLLAITSSYPANAADKEFCTDYVLVAISQYWQSIDEECGLSGMRWSSNYKGQYEWCLTAHQWVAENETAARERMLQECRANKEKKPNIAPDKVDKAANENIAVSDATTAIQEQLNIKLLAAVAEDNLDKVKQVVSEGADIHYVTDDLSLINDYNMSYQLGKAVTIQGNAAASTTTTESTLVKNTVDGERQSDSPQSEPLLSYAISKGLVNVGLWLLEQEKTVLRAEQSQHLKRNLLGNALIEAVKKKDLEQVNGLLEKGAQIDYELDSNFGTPLYFAVTSGDSVLAKALLEKGANVKYSTNAGQNLLSYAVDNIQLLKLLLDYGADPNSNAESPSSETYPLIQAVKNGNSEAVELLMSQGAKADLHDYNIPYPIMQAVIDQEVQIVEILLNYGADPNVVYNPVTLEGCKANTKNLVPLDEALRIDNTKLVSILKKAGAKSEKEICGSLSE